MNSEGIVDATKKKESTQVYPVALFCGYSKSGTTIIAKTIAHCLNQPWNNEVRELWGIGATINRTRPLNEFHDQFKNSDRWTNAQQNVALAPILKFPEGMLIIDLFPPETSTVCVVRNPLDNVCAYLERKHEFTTLDFTTEELISRAEDWNYHYLSAGQASRLVKFVRYEDFIVDPNGLVRDVSNFLNQPILNQLPDWVNEQAQPYYRYVSEGHEIRGAGRYELSIKSQQVKDSALEACQPALEYLKTVGIRFEEVLK